MPEVRPEYTQHARDRMAQRGISEQAVEYVLDAHNISIVRADGKKELIGTFQGERLKVVIDDRRQSLVIIAVHALPGGNP